MRIRRSILELNDNWVIEKDEGYSSMYFLGHRCEEGNYLRSIHMATGASSRIKTCLHCSKRAPDWAIGYLNLCRSTNNAEV